MKRNSIYFIAFSLCIMFCLSNVYAQDKISWLQDYTSEIPAGSYTYRYDYFTLEKDCKIRIEEKKTNKKGVESTISSEFYLSDISPSSLSFKSSGNLLAISMETVESQKFISLYEGDELDGYTNELSVYTDEVDKARAIIESFLSHIETCKDNEKTWTSTEEAFNWLNQNIGESIKSGSVYKQKFTKGNKSFLVSFESETTDSKGNQQTSQSTLDVSDMDPANIKLEVSGITLKINIPVRDKQNYVQVKSGDGEINYTKDLNIYIDDVEDARNKISALKYLISNTEVQRTNFAEYNQAMLFVKENLKEVHVGSNTLSQSLSFENSPSGLVSFKVIKTDSKGISNEELSEFYLCDIANVNLKISSGNAYITIETVDNLKYIRQSIHGELSSYSNNLEIYTSEIDEARDLIHALTFAQKTCNIGLLKFDDMEFAKEWLSSNLEEILFDSETIRQQLAVASTEGNKIELKLIKSSEGSTPVDETFEIYPEDLSMKDIGIEISGKKLSVPLSTGKLKYIKSYLDGEIQTYNKSVEVLFSDVKKAKNFIAAIGFIHQNSESVDHSFADEKIAFDYLENSIGKVEISGTIYDQKIERDDENKCKLTYSCSQTDSKGTTIQFSYEFHISDIDTDHASIEISGKELKVDLITTEKEKLIKPFKEGEAGSFTYNFDIYTDDTLTARKIIAAFDALADQCK